MESSIKCTQPKDYFDKDASIKDAIKILKDNGYKVYKPSPLIKRAAAKVTWK